MKKSVISLSLFILVTVLSIFTFACTKTEEKNVKAEAVGQTILTENSETNQVVKTRPPETNVNRRLSEISEPEGRDFLLYPDKISGAVAPQDFKIGELAVKSGNDKNTQEIITTAERFLKSITDNDMDSQLICTEKRDFVERNLTDALKITIPQEYRIGVIISETDPIWCYVRLMRETGSADGVLYFVREESWKIYDFHIDFREMLTPEDLKGEEYLWETVSVE